MKITKSDIQKYESVRQSGVTNMFDTRAVEIYSGLSREKQIFIMKNYTALIKKFKLILQEGDLF